MGRYPKPTKAEAERIERDDPGRPVVHIEHTCNELWLDADEARAVIAYLQRVLPELERGGEDD